MPLNLSTSKLPTRQLLMQSWDLLLDNYGLIAVALLTHSLRAIVLAAVVLAITIKNPYSPAFALTVAGFSGATSILEIPRISLDLVRGRKITLLTKPDLTVLLSWLLAFTCCTASLLVGLSLLVIPGLLFGLFSSFYGFAIIDGQSPIQSIKTSFRIATGSFWQILKIYAACSIPLLIFSAPLFHGFDLVLETIVLLALAGIYNAATIDSECLDDKQTL